MKYKIERYAYWWVIDKVYFYGLFKKRLDVEFSKKEHAETYIKELTGE